MRSSLIQEFKLFAPIQLNHNPSFAHLDTGASGSLLLSTETVGMEQLDSHLMQGGLGQQPVQRVRIEHLAFLGQEFAGTPAAVIDGAGYFADVLPARPLVDFKRLWLGFEEGPFDPALSVFARFPVEAANRVAR